MRSSHRALFLVVAMGCGANCPETSNSIFPPPAEDQQAVGKSGEQTANDELVTVPDAEGPACDIPLGASMTEIKQRYGEPDATSEPQEVATEYHYYGKLLIIYRMHRVEDVILQQGGHCPE